MKLKQSFIIKGLLAGICIGIGGLAFIKVGELFGAILFSFGLISVLTYKLNLFTGKAGDMNIPISHLFAILVLNILGCGVVGQFSDIQTSIEAQRIIGTHATYGFFKNIIYSILCGMIMTMAVRGSIANVIFGVTAFIMCGFPHCVADAYYLSCCPFQYLWSNAIDILSFYGVVVIGNFLGCNMLNIIDGNNN